MKRLLLIPLVLFLACEDKQEKIYGCTDSEACNFNPDATIFDNSCYYATCQLLGTWELSLVLNQEITECFNYDNVSLTGDTIETDWLDFITFYDDSFYRCNTIGNDNIPNNYNSGTGTGTYIIHNNYDKWSNTTIDLENMVGFGFNEDNFILFSKYYYGPDLCLSFIYNKSDFNLDSTHCQ